MSITGQMYFSRFLLLTHLRPTRITSHSNTLMDKIFSNVIDPDIISGNLTATISDHLTQFSMFPNMFGNISGNKYIIYERDCSKFDQESFIPDYFSVDVGGFIEN